MHALRVIGMVESRKVDVAILGAVLQEVEALLRPLESIRSFLVHGEDFFTGTFGNHFLLIGTTGLGKVNAAITVGAVVERFSIGEIWNIGSAGAYAEGPLKVGDALFTTRAISGDEGVLSGEGVLPLETIGIPSVKRGDEAFYDSFPAGSGIAVAGTGKTPPGIYLLSGESRPAAARLFAGDGDVSFPGDAPCKPDECPVCRAAEPAGPAGGMSGDSTAFRLHHGPSLTVSMTSGDMETARARFRRFGALAENMEGSAVIHACTRIGVPAAEIRGISNIAGNRSKRDWRIETAVAHCHGIVMNWLGAAGKEK